MDRTQGITINLHQCGALNGVSIPLVRIAGPTAVPDARNVAVLREDYAGSENPLAAVRTEHGDGSNDVTVMIRPAVIDPGSGA